MVFQYPVIDKQLLANLRLLHGIFNTCVMLLFMYQGWAGFSIRRARRQNAPIPLPAIKRHRKMGPIFATLAGLGFLAGLILVLLDTGNILEYPGHLFASTLIVILLLVTYLVSRKIKGPDSPYRTPHFILGLVILLLYLVNVFLGVGVLL